VDHSYIEKHTLTIALERPLRSADVFGFRMQSCFASIDPNTLQIKHDLHDFGCQLGENFGVLGCKRMQKDAKGCNPARLGHDRPGSATTGQARPDFPQFSGSRFSVGKMFQNVDRSSRELASSSERSTAEERIRRREA